MEGEYAIVCILISKIRWCKVKLKAREWSYSMDLKPWVFADSVEWRKGPSVGEEGRLFYSRYNPALLPPRLSSLWHAGMRGAKGPNKVLRSTKERTEEWHDKRMRKEGVWYRRQDAHEQLKQAKLQAGRKDHHKSSTLHHRVSSRSNDEGNILR